MRIIFMGTPDFAVPCLQKLIDAGHDICGVFTQPDKPKGRGYTLMPPPVKELALQHGLTVYQPTTLRDDEVQQLIADLQPELIVVVAYGKLLSKAVLDIPPRGCVNVHGSLLPKYRGAAPIQWTVLNGDAIAGVTTMFMGEGLDTGDMLLKAETPVGENETSGELFERLCHLGADLIIDTIEALKDETITPIPQNEEEASYASMLSKKDSPIDWNKTAQQVHNQVRGLSPWPVANTVYHGKQLKIHQTLVASKEHGNPGDIIEKNNKFFVCCGDGAVELVTVQYEGGKRMSARDFFRGRPLKENENLLTQ